MLLSTRRSLLGLSLAAGTLASTRSHAAPVRLANTSEPFDLAAFERAWRALADEMREQAPFHDALYVARVEALVHRLPRTEIPRLDEPSFERDGLASGGSWGDGELGLVEIRLEPGAEIPAHNHVAYNFTTLCLEGSCEYRHYAPAAPAPAPQSDRASEWFEVEQVRAGLLEPGRVTNLMRTWDNVHWFRAGEQGAVLVDFMTHLPSIGEGFESFSALEVERGEARGARLRRRARWVGNPYR